MQENTIKTKDCPKCGKTKELTEFHLYKRKSGKLAYKSYCKTCSRTISKQWKDNNKEHVEKYIRNYYIEHSDIFNKIPYAKTEAMGVYMFKNLITGECYIGAAKNMPRRVSRHFTPRGRSRNRFIYKSVKTYGKQAHVWGPIEYCNTMEEAFARETYWINKLNPTWNTLKVNKEI